MGQLMKNNRNFKKDRREFVKTCLRYGLGGGLLITGAILGFREQNPEEGTSDCSLKNPCQGCSKYTGCSLPKAQNAKTTETKTTI